MTMMVGTMLRPIPREAAMLASIRALTPKEKPMIFSRCIPAAITSASLAKSPRNLSPNSSSSPPQMLPTRKEYSRTIR